MSLLNSKSAAFRLGVTVKKIREMARNGVIKAHKTGAAIGGHGRDWVFETKDVEDYINGMKFGAQELPLTTERDLATRLLTFDGVDEHNIWPLGTYTLNEIEGDMIEAVLYDYSNDNSMFRGTYGARDQAIEACRADLRIRLAAVDELRGAA